MGAAEELPRPLTTGLIMTIISTMRRDAGAGLVGGECAHCHKPVYESQWLLDDAYNVWVGKCPHCKALNYLSMNHGLRGYSASHMHLVLPTIEEVEANGLPADTPNRGAGGPTTSGGTQAGQLQHKLRNGGA